MGHLTHGRRNATNRRCCGSKPPPGPSRDLQLGHCSGWREQEKGTAQRTSKCHPLAEVVAMTRKCACIQGPTLQQSYARTYQIGAPCPMRGVSSTLRSAFVNLGHAPSVWIFSNAVRNTNKTTLSFCPFRRKQIDTACSRTVCQLQGPD